MEIKSYRVILKKEEPSTDLSNELGSVKCQESMIKFTPQKFNENLSRSYPMKDLQFSSVATLGSWFRKSKVVHLRFGSRDVFVNVYLEPMDHSPDFVLAQILECVEKYKKGTLPGIVGSLLDKIGGESQKIIKEMGAIIQSSSKELTTALSQTREFMQQAIQTANILESFETDEKTQSKTINLDLNDIDEIMKRALASEKIDAMISSLIAKGLVSANDQNFQEALEALKIARDAAKNENMEEYEKLAEENIKKVKEAETSNYMNQLDPQFTENATKYAQDARNIVAEWEESKLDEPVMPNLTRIFVLFLIIFIPMPVTSGLCSLKNLNVDHADSVYPYFNGTKAYELIEDQVQFGPRIPGSEAIENTRHLIKKTMSSEGMWEIGYQNFTREWIDSENISLVNMIISPSIQDQNQSIFLLLAHYDSRRWADQDTNPALRTSPVLGANDGASGVAVALELGRVLLTNHQISNFKIILFDAEDQGNIGWDWILGSRYYVNSNLFDQDNITFALLFDMVGAKEAIFKREGFSDKYAQSLVSMIWNTADKLNFDNFFINKSWSKITDDHLPFLEQGIPAVDIIDDFITNYKAWHTTGDTLDKISSETLTAVGQSVEVFLSETQQNNESLLTLSSFSFQSTTSIWITLFPLLVVVLIHYIRKRS